MEKYFHFDRNKSLQELEKASWIMLGYDSNLATKCFELRKVPICAFTVEDIRILIGQELSLDYLMPLALEILEDNVLSQGDLYCGDLLDSVLKVDKSFWEDNPGYKDELELILKNAINEFEHKLNTFQQRCF